MDAFGEILHGEGVCVVLESEELSEEVSEELSSSEVSFTVFTLADTLFLLSFTLLTLFTPVSDFGSFFLSSFIDTVFVESRLSSLLLLFVSHEKSELFARRLQWKKGFAGPFGVSWGMSGSSTSKSGVHSQC